MGHIVDLSTELLELTISSILKPIDLFNLALTCKGLHNLIVPYHLYFREIVTIWGDHFQVDCALWNTINQRPILAHHTQTLQFVLPSSHHVGLCLAKSRARVLENVEWTPGDSLPQEIFETIPKSVLKMVNLRILMWFGMNSKESILRGVMDGLDNFPNFTSLVINNKHEHEGRAMPFPAQQLSFLTTLALGVPCLCKSCASMPFYQKLLFEPFETLQDVQLQLPYIPIHGESPVSSQWNDAFETVNWPNIRRLTVELNGNNLRTSLSCPYPILETFIARHPLMESLAYFGNLESSNTLPYRTYNFSNQTFDFSFALGNPSKLHSLKYILSNCYYLPDIRELVHVCDLQFVNRSIDNNEQLEAMGSLPNLRICLLKTRSQKFLARFVRLFPGVEKLKITLDKRQPDISLVSNYIAKLEGLNKLTHLSGLLTTPQFNKREDELNYESDYLLKIAAKTIPSLTHVEIRRNRQRVWALIERNARGEYMSYKVKRLNHGGPPGWGLFFFGV